MSKEGDIIKFRFAGVWEQGRIMKVIKKGNKILSYKVSDGKYNYSVDRGKIKK
jgi:hypothetical protein